MANKKIVAAVIGTVGACAVGFGGWKLWQHYAGGGPTRSEKVYVQRVGNVNTVSNANLLSSDFAGVIVAQKTVDVKYDSTQTIDEILVIAYLSRDPVEPKLLHCSSRQLRRCLR